jgi:polyhydroxybutyrate depolymerase
MPRSLPALVLALTLLVACASADGSANGDVTTITSAPEPAPEPAPACHIEPEAVGPGPDDVGAGRAHNLAVPDGAGPFPAVISLHGVSGTKDHQDAATGLPEHGRVEGFVTLTPETAPDETRWSLDPDGEDVAYLLALADRLAAAPCVDGSRIYLAGFSMGAMMALQLSCVAPERFAAVGTVSGLVDVDACSSGPAEPLVAVHGTADPSIGYDGVMAPSVVDLVGYAVGPDVESLAASWADRQGCTTPPREEHHGDDRRLDFCDDVALVAVTGGDHVWPGPNAGTALDANRVLWAFFDDH